MKKKFKKLALNTETLRKMDSGDLGQVVGGSVADTDCTIVGSGCTVPCTVCMNCTTRPTCPSFPC